jgi:hypothetical protein
MRKFDFVVGYVDANTNKVLRDVIIQVRAFTYKGARTKALNLAQAGLRKHDEAGKMTYMRLCRM